MLQENLPINLADFAADIHTEIKQFNPAKANGIIYEAYIHNKWFTYDNIIFALEKLANSLDSKKTKSWLKQYKFSKINKPLNIILVLPGNIPAVGFHDILCTLISGHKALVKLSSNDSILIPWLCKLLEKHIPEWKGKYQIHKSLIKDFDAVIATGSNNSERYFKKYFSKVPNIIRHNRNSIAIIDGSESDEELVLLKNDIFRYFGLGCRSVSLIFVPEKYKWDKFIELMNVDSEIMFHNAYSNNHSYYSAYFALMDEKIIDAKSFLLRENNSPASPLAVIHYSYYKSKEEVDQYISEHSQTLQCVVSNLPNKTHIAFGMSQSPEIDEYADNIDTIGFLLSLKAN